MGFNNVRSRKIAQRSPPPPSCVKLHCTPLLWRHHKPDGVSNDRQLDRLLNRLFRRRSKKISNPGVTSLCQGNPPVTGGFPSQGASNAENASIWWRHHDLMRICSQYLTPIVYFSILYSAISSVVRATLRVGHSFTIFLLQLAERKMSRFRPAKCRNERGEHHKIYRISRK